MDHIQELKKQNQALIREILTEGQKKGVFKKNIDLPILMMTLVGTISQLLTTQHYYKEINGLQDMPADEFQKHIRKKLSQHLKKIFHAILSNEVLHLYPVHLYDGRPVCPGTQAADLR